MSAVDHPSEIGVGEFALNRADSPNRPGRLHHCMRSIGIASRALDLLLQRVSDPVRKTFGKELREHGTFASHLPFSRLTPSDIQGPCCPTSPAREPRSTKRDC